MALLFTITQGWTKELGPFLLENNDAAVDLTGMTVRLMLRGNGAPQFIPGSGQVRKDADQAGAGRGRVYYKPTATDFRSDRNPYTIHWEVTDQAGDIVFFPNGTPDTIGIAPQ